MYRADDCLVQVGPMIFAVPILAQFVAAFPFKVNRDGVEKDQLQLGEQVAAALE
jgi:hypothetical protein